ncbi:hypothetical protein EC973_006183 [Apophysomyces ossiformis]|uniref:Ubiquitin carboxyl-terminal hydrolase n=1 Tax=Apophysomyces ossiformis TaxID=679940 RepID=A0A8H7EQL8_9FUNG|nr:hypothetical protein EC973_006183 [Apophysomyces ossiformis]
MLPKVVAKLTGGYTLPVRDSVFSLVGLRDIVPASVEDSNNKYGASFFIDADICLSPVKDAHLVAGLVNTGNSCFLNSVLQALSSLPRLHHFLDRIDRSARHQLPVTRSLLKTLKLLSRPIGQRTSFRPIDLVSSIASNPRVTNQEQQDAQELFQLISSELDTENHGFEKRGLIGGGLRDLLSLAKEDESKRHWRKNRSSQLENPFTGLLANRLSCTHCGYTEAIRHFSFNNVQLTLPNKPMTTLDECLEQMTTMEHLNDVTCRKCSLIDTMESLKREIDGLTEQARQATETGAKREILMRLVNAERSRRTIEHRLEVGSIEEEEHEPFKHLLRRVSRLSTKQVMFAKLPKILCLHINRSAYHSSGLVYKNRCQIVFPEYLDLSPYSTSGTLHTQPSEPISSPVNDHPTAKYRLMSTIVHFGTHNFGHFIAYKRRILPACCPCSRCGPGEMALTGQDEWYRISDEKVELCSTEDALQANPYMLLYECVDTSNGLDAEDDYDDEEAYLEEEDLMAKNDIYYPDQTLSCSIEALKMANTLLMDDRFSHTGLPAAHNSWNHSLRRKRTIVTSVCANSSPGTASIG